MHKMKKILLLNAFLVNPDNLPETVHILIEGERISEIFPTARGKVESNITIDLAGKPAFPGFVNPHDHFMGTWSPRLGSGPYKNARLWQEDIFSEEKPHREYREKKRVMNEATFPLYQLGMYKNIFSGVTTVSDHFPKMPDEFYAQSPIRIIQRYRQAHSVYWNNRWGGKDLTEEFAEARGEMPFIIHIAEGTDEESQRELRQLDELGSLAENTILIHGIAFSDEDISLLAKRGGNLVWCPDSNRFLIGKTADVKQLLEKGINVSLGTDSTMSGSDNLFDELRCAKESYQERYGEDISNETLFKMTTTNAAKALMVSDEVGTVEAKKFADILVLRGSPSNPLKSLMAVQPGDIELLLCGGKPVLSAMEYHQLFSEFSVSNTLIDINGEVRLVAGCPFSPIKQIQQVLGYAKRFDFLPFSH